MKDPFRFTFFILPLELRCMIHDYCLNIGRVFPYYWAGGAAEGFFPTVALLRVCKIVHQEAEPFVQCNTFVYSRYQAIEQLFNVYLATKERKLFLPSVDISVFYNGINGRAAVHQAQMMTIDADVENLPDDAPYSRSCRILHHLTKSWTKTDHWQRTVSLVLDSLEPDRLIVNLRERYCISGCCDVKLTATGCLCRGFALVTPRAVKIEELLEFD